MRRGTFLLWMLGSILWLSPSELFADEHPGAPESGSETQISTEDQKVIALMELLEKMDMLQDLEVMTAGEEVKK